jgi:ERCC4-related helicase
MPHAIQRLYRAENLVRQRRSDERQRYAASQRRGRIDPNPHQIDAVIFALRRIPEGGCILADEVGLGKTIEAGLVIAQLLAEGARRVLLVLPKPLMGQWQHELYTLFGIETREVVSDPESLEGQGVFVVGREMAGGERGAGLIRSCEPFDLCVIDEAHEIFAGIYRRFGSDGVYKPEVKEASTAHRVRSFLGATPVLLLTATPIQNSLAELWGLVQYVEPTGTLLGNIATFRDLFCEPGSNDRLLVPAQAGELRRRINVVCQRTLRRQAQEFLEKPFTRRRAQLVEYSMSPEEKTLYDDVTGYLMEPTLCAFSGGSRRLLLISFHRLMASSQAAFAKSLRKVAERLEKRLAGAPLDGSGLAEVTRDFEGELPETADDSLEETTEISPDAIRRELERVRDFIQRAEQLQHDSKAVALLQAIRNVLRRGQTAEGSGKTVIFTESLTTQDYLARLLIDGDLGLSQDDITIFRGTNDSSRAAAALERWREEVEPHIPPDSRPSRDVAVRLALIHEFKTRSKVFIATEAGAKGLNLQFCETLINYDLPWNPQRIEQRIGRCHRYSQTRDVTVINFISRENEAQRLMFNILSEKLELFGQVLDASDVVLHEPAIEVPETLTTALGADFETQLARIYERARSKEELSEEIRELGESMDQRRSDFEDVQRRMQGLIQTRFDESVRTVFRQLADELPQTLQDLDRQIEQVVCGFLDARQVPYDRHVDAQHRVRLDIGASDQLPELLREGARFVVGHSKDLEDYSPLHLGHALVEAAVAEARTSAAGATQAFVQIAAAELSDLRGRRGRLVIAKLMHTGFERFERIVPLVFLDDGSAHLPPHLGELLLQQEFREGDAPPAGKVSDEIVQDALDECVFRTQAEIADQEQRKYEQTMNQLERYVDDQALVTRRELAGTEFRLNEAMAKREGAIGPEARSRFDRQIANLESAAERLQARIDGLESRQDDDYQRWRQRAWERRYAEPAIEKLVDVELLIQ